MKQLSISTAIFTLKRAKLFNTGYYLSQKKRVSNKFVDTLSSFKKLYNKS